VRPWWRRLSWRSLSPIANLARWTAGPVMLTVQRHMRDLQFPNLPPILPSKTAPNIHIFPWHLVSTEGLRFRISRLSPLPGRANNGSHQAFNGRYCNCSGHCTMDHQLDIYIELKLMLCGKKDPLASPSSFFFSFIRSRWIRNSLQGRRL